MLQSDLMIKDKTFIVLRSCAMLYFRYFIALDFEIGGIAEWIKDKSEDTCVDSIAFTFGNLQWSFSFSLIALFYL